MEFLQNGGYPIIDVYRAYKRDPAKYKELVKKCRFMHEALVKGDGMEYKDDPLFPAIQMHVFPPDMTVTREMYHEITSHREGRQADVEVIPADMRKSGPVSLATGSYVLKDPASPLDTTSWSVILDVVKKENAAAEHKISAEESWTLGSDLLASWQVGNLEKDKRDLLARLYKYRLANGGGALPQDLNSVQNIMVLKEFAGDKLRDIVSDVLKGYQVSEPEKYTAVLNKMFQTKINKGAAKAVAGVLATFKNDSVKGKSVLGRMLKITDEDVLVRLWEDLSVLTDIKDIENSLGKVEFKVRPGKEADTIARLLLGKDLGKMQGEFSAKYKFNEGKDHLNVRFEVSKKQAHGVVGLNMGVCVAADKKLWDDPNFMNVIIWNEEGIAMGGMHILFMKDKGKTYVSLPGLNPSTGLMVKVSADDVYNKLVAYAWRINDALGHDGVIIPTNATIHSNRSEIQRVIAARQYEKIVLSKEQQFSYSPQEYTFSEAYIVDRAERVKPGDLAAKVANGGIDLDASRLDLQARKASDGVKFYFDPAMISRYQSANGFIPVIFNIRPMTETLRMFLGRQQ